MTCSDFLIRCSADDSRTSVFVPNLGDGRAGYTDGDVWSRLTGAKHCITLSDVCSLVRKQGE